jgi:hypothetical protein
MFGEYALAKSNTNLGLFVNCFCLEQEVSSNLSL